jgi:hypothetical protein
MRGNREPLWTIPPADLDAHVAALPELERFEQLPELARNAYNTVAAPSQTRPIRLVPQSSPRCSDNPD